MDLMAFCRGTTFATLEQHTEGQVTIGGSVQECCLSCRAVNLVHWDGDLASAIGGINDFHEFDFGLHYFNFRVLSVLYYSL
jgi:hypothetical protein